MKAWYLLGPHRFELGDAPDPTPGAGEALVRVKAVGVCGSDAEALTGRHPAAGYPRLPGHEFAGEVAAVGADWEGVAVGTRVAVDPALSCGECYACRQGRHNCCVEVSIAGVHRPGALTEHIVCRASQLHAIPDGVETETAAVIETLSIGSQAVARGDVRAGDRVVVLGAGPVGLCCLMMARQRGAQVLVSEPLEWRRELAAELGADRCVDPESGSVADAVREATDGWGAHVVIDATGEPAAAESAFSLVGSAGRIVVLTLSLEPIRMQPWQLVRQELTIVGSRLTLADFGELTGLVASGSVALAKIITHRYGFDDAASAFQAVSDREPGLVKAVIAW